MVLVRNAKNGVRRDFYVFVLAMQNGQVISMDMAELKRNLSEFTGTERYYKYMNLKLTDGTKYLGETAECFWLFDAICSYQGEPKVKSLSMQFWRLNVKESKGVLTCEEDVGIKPVVTQNISYTDFPEGEIMLYVQNGVLFLPSEY